MNILRFDEGQLVSRLSALPGWARVAIAAACAERMKPAYQQFCERTHMRDPMEFSVLLERLWSDLEGVTMDDQELKTSIDRSMKLIPHEDEAAQWSEQQAVAEDAAAALTYALRCRQSWDPSECAWAARRVYEAVDHTVIAMLGVDVNEPGAEKRVLSHSLIQAELARQHRDVTDLHKAKDEVRRECVRRIRQQAVDESELLFHLVPAVADLRR